MSRAEELLGEQKYTGGDIEREERVSRWHSGQLLHIGRSGAVLGSQAVRWQDWPRVNHAMWLTTMHTRPQRWNAGRVTEATVKLEGVEFVAAGARYRLSVDR